jgi:hypothetical protein
LNSQKLGINDKLFFALIAISVISMISLTNQAYADVQFARPDTDIETSGWTTIPIFSKINEIIVDDTSVRTGINPVGEDFTVSLSDVVDPLSSINHVVRYVYDKDLGADSRSRVINITVELKQGLNVISSHTHFDITGDPTFGSFTLSQAEADSITDYSDLRLTFTANTGAGLGERLAKIKWAELEVPSPTPPEEPPIDSPVSGKLLSIDSTTLMVAGLSSGAIWMIPTIVGIAGVGFYIIKSKSNNP